MKLDKDTILETLTDENLEPHAYLAAILIVVIIVSIIIAFVAT